MKRKDDLTETIEDIGFGLKPDWDEKYVAPITLSRAPGPNNWDKIKDDPRAYGKNFDYEIYDHAADQIIYPVCEAALQWCFAHLPEDNPRWGATGFKVDITELPWIVAAMTRDKLISESEYVKNMENEQLMRSGE